MEGVAEGDRARRGRHAVGTVFGQPGAHRLGLRGRQRHSVSPWGLAIGSFPIVRRLLEPYTEFLRFIPATALITVAVIWFGIGEGSKVFLIIYTTVFIVIINTAAGVSAVAPNKIRAARSLGASAAQVFFFVALPATVPVHPDGHAACNGQFVRHHRRRGAGRRQQRPGPDDLGFADVHAGRPDLRRPAGSPGCSASPPTGCSAGASARVRRTILAGDGNGRKMRRRTLLAAGALASVSLAAVSRNVVAQTLTKMTIATGVDPAFSQFYVAKEAGFFEKNGLDVTINTGPSGSAMIPFLVNNQVSAAYGGDLAGVISHQVDPNIVAVADGTYLVKWLSVIGKNVPDLEALKGKKVGIAMGTGSGEIFWRRVVERGLKVADFTMVNVEAPEMLAAIRARRHRRLRGVGAVADPHAHVGQGHQGAADRRGHLQQRELHLREPRLDREEQGDRREVHAVADAGQRRDRKDRPAAAKLVAKFLKMPLELATELMPKVEFDMDWQPRSIEVDPGLGEAARGPEEAQGAAGLRQVRLHGPREGRAPGEHQDQRHCRSKLPNAELLLKRPQWALHEPRRSCRAGCRMKLSALQDEQPPRRALLPTVQQRARVGVRVSAGTLAQAHSRFCDACGTPLRALPPARSPRGEHARGATKAAPPRIARSKENKQVTVLFGDIVNSTGLTEDWDRRRCTSCSITSST